MCEHIEGQLVCPFVSGRKSNNEISLFVCEYVCVGIVNHFQCAESSFSYSSFCHIVQCADFQLYLDTDRRTHISQTEKIKFDAQTQNATDFHFFSFHFPFCSYLLIFTLWLLLLHISNWIKYFFSFFIFGYFCSFLMV